MLAPIWEGIGAQLTLLNHPHLSAFILHLAGDLLSSVRASGIAREGLVAPLVPLLLWWSVVIATSETGVTTKAGGLDGSVVRVSGAVVDRIQESRTFQTVQTRSQLSAFSCVARYDRSSRLEADYYSFPRPLRNKLTTRSVPRCY